MNSDKGEGRYLISIASYKRPDELRTLLDSLLRTGASGQFQVVVVDNDPKGSAREVATNHALGLRYVIESAPGIASARNRGLEYFTEEHEAIIFVDDDEWVERNWFREITDYAKNSGADVVNGPVITVLPPQAPEWVRAGGFYQRPRQPTGALLPSAATNNTLLTHAAWVRTGRQRFDTGFSTTGGSDWDFFWRLRKAGCRLRYCASAEVYESIPDSRLRMRWIIRRSVRNGIVNTRVRLKSGDPVIRFIPRGLARVGYNLASLSIGVISGRGLQSKPLNAVLHEYGKIAGLSRYRIHEYKRAE